MNLYGFLMMYCLYFTSILASPNRGDTVRKMLQERQESQQTPNPNKPQKRVQRHRYSERNRWSVIVKPFFKPTPTTTTTKSPFQIQKEKQDREKKRNPKGIRKGSIGDQMKAFSNKLNKLQHRCAKNVDCPKNFCCMMETGSGYCMKKPGHYQLCSGACPCSGKMECKVNKEINEKGRSTYNKQCLKITEPESADVKSMKKMGFVKQRLGRVKEGLGKRSEGPARLPSNIDKKRALPIKELQQ